MADNYAELKVYIRYVCWAKLSAIRHSQIDQYTEGHKVKTIWP